MPVVLRREKPKSAGRVRKGAAFLSSLAERTLKGSTVKLCMLKSPGPSYAKSQLKK